MQTEKEILRILDGVLNLNGRAMAFSPSSELLGAVPELDSMGVVAVLNAIEETFGITVEDDEIDGTLFATVESLTAFVDGKLG